MIPAARALLTGALLLAWAGPAPAIDTPNERLSLGGLTAVHLVVDDLPAEVAPHGLTRAALQAETEARLRRAGLRVLGATEALKAPGRPTLHVRVELTPFTDARRFYLYSVDLTLRQQTQLSRDRTVETFTITWSEHRQVGAVEPAGLGAVRDLVRAKVEQFVRAWQTVNETRQ
jgi:hypothetical protein